MDMDFLYQFNLGLIAPLHFFSWNVWKKNVLLNFQKLAGLWLVGEVNNDVAIYGSKVAEGFWGVPMLVLWCFEIPRVPGHKVACRAYVRIPMYSGL